MFENAQSGKIEGVNSRMKLIAFLAGVVLLASCTSPEVGPSVEKQQALTELTVEILATHPFDPTSFTQGLEFDGEQLLVGTGWWGESQVYYRTIDGQQSELQSLDQKQFGEGVTKSGDHVWQLTWKDGIAYKRDAQTLAVVDTASYEGEGWGLCSFDDVLVMSDGTETLKLLDPATFALKDQMSITLDFANSSAALNELECVTTADGKRLVYANVFMTTDIYVIDVNNGTVSQRIDASNVPNNAEPDSNNVLNGIAHIPGSDRFFITGKRWPDLYEVRFVEKS